MDRPSFCYICRQLHFKEALAISAPLLGFQKRFVTVTNVDHQCVLNCGSMLAYKKAENKQLIRRQTKIDEEPNRLMLRPGRVSPHTFWKATEAAESAATSPLPIRETGGRPVRQVVKTLKIFPAGGS